MVMPEYPEAERKAGVEGSVMLEAVIRQDGSVGEITVIEGVDGHPALEQSAVEALKRWRFEPATEDGNPVAMAVQIPLAFRLNGKEEHGGKTGAADAGGPGGRDTGEDTMPELIPESMVMPEYPEEAREAGVTGKLILETEVEPNGAPGKITVKEGIPGYPAFDEAAIAAVRQWRFKPGTRAGEPVASTVMIPLEFNLEDKKQE
jgi:protein TonB